MKKLLSALTLLTTSLVSHAWTPERNVDFIIPWSAGGGYDLAARTMIPAMEEYFRNKGVDVTIIPRNVEGAGGRKAAKYLQDSGNPDGHEIMMFNVPGHGESYIRGEEDPLYNLTDFTYLGTISRDNYVLMVKNGGPIKSFGDLEKMDVVIIPEQGPGNTSYLVSNIIWKELSQINVKRVYGFKGSSKVAMSVLQGEGDLMVSGSGSGGKYAESGDFIIIADFSDNPVNGVPNGTTLGHPEWHDLQSLRTVVGPPNMPIEIAEEWNDAIDYGLSHPDVIKITGKLGNELIIQESTETTRQTVFKVFDAFKEK